MVLFNTTTGCMIAEPTLRNVDYKFVDGVSAGVLAKHLLPEYTVIYLPTAQTSPFKIKLGVMFPSCVGYCQRATGVTFHAFTPYRYAKALLRNGAHLMGVRKPKIDRTAQIRAQREAERARAEQQRMLEEQRKERERLAAEEAARIAEEKQKQEDLRNRLRRGRRSLLGTEGDELGVS